MSTVLRVAAVLIVMREQVHAVRVPVAVVAGAADEVIPAAQSRAVAAAADLGRARAHQLLPKRVRR